MSNKMALVDGAAFRTPKRGRPSVYDDKTTRIRLTVKVFDLWKTMKQKMGFADKTHSEFAELLLRKCADSESTNQDTTDIAKTGNTVNSDGKDLQMETSSTSNTAVLNASTINAQIDREVELSQESDFSDFSSDESNVKQPSSDSSKRSSEKFEAKRKCFDFVGILSAPANDFVNMEPQDAHPILESSDPTGNCGPETRQQRDERLNSKIKEQFDLLFTETTESEQYLQQDRVVVDVKKLLSLFEKSCLHSPSCSALCKVVHYKLFCGILKVSWQCSNNHRGCWVSSQELCEKNGQPIYTTSLLFALAVIISGCQFSQLLLFSKFLGLNFISKITYQRIQRLYITPSVASFWEDMKSKIWKILTNEQLFLCGDGRNDSSGQSPNHYVHVLMEQFLDLIVDIEVTTKKKNSELENFNSMVLRYAPKTVEFQNDAFTTRILLAVIDHNSHLHRKPLLGKDGKLKYNNVFQRSDRLGVSVAKEDKTYDYWNIISARVLKSRKDDKGRKCPKIPL